MLVDQTPPPVAGVTAAITTQFVINLTLANDPESGLAGVDIAFGTSATDPTLNPRATGTIVIPYTTYAAVVGTSKRAIAIPPGTVLPTPLYVYVRVRNGAGLLSTATSVRLR